MIGLNDDVKSDMILSILVVSSFLNIVYYTFNINLLVDVLNMIYATVFV